MLLCHRCKNALPESDFSPFARRASKPSLQICRRCHNEATKAWQAKNPHRVRDYNRAYEDANREKRNAKREVLRAVEDGRLEKLPCVVCGLEDSEAHHSSYLEKDWLSVIWLCAVHNKQAHTGELSIEGLPMTHGTFGKNRKWKLIRQAVEGKSVQELYDKLGQKS